MIRNILFDLGNVLIDVDIRKTLRAYESLLAEDPNPNRPYQASPQRGGCSRARGCDDPNPEPCPHRARESEGRKAERLIGGNNTIITAGDLIGAGESELVAKYQVGAVSTDEFVEGILKICKPGTTRQEVVDAWMAMLIGIPEERRQKVLELHKQGYKLYVLSNINELHAVWTREQLRGIPFEAVYFSNEMGMAKPDARCYEQVIRETGIVPEETLYIDDLPENIEAGRRAGLQCFLNTKADAWCLGVGE